MRILITGGTGFVGKEVAKTLSRQDHKIYILSRQSKNIKKHLPFPCEIIDKTEIPNLPGVDAVINLMGETVGQRWTKAVKARIEISRVDKTLELIDFLKYIPEKPKVFLSASAIGYYGDRGEELLDETSIKGHDFLSDVCEKWEHASLSASNLGERVAIFRLGHVLGKGGLLEKMSLPFKFGLGGALGEGKQWMSWVHIHDLTKIFEWGLQNGDGIYNAVSPNPVRNLDFSKSLADVFHKKLFLNVPPIVIKARFGDMNDVIFSSQRVVPAKLESFKV